MSTKKRKKAAESTARLGFVAMHPSAQDAIWEAAFVERPVPAHWNERLKYLCAQRLLLEVRAFKRLGWYWPKAREELFSTVFGVSRASETALAMRAVWRGLSNTEEMLGAVRTAYHLGGEAAMRAVIEGP